MKLELDNKLSALDDATLERAKSLNEFQLILNSNFEDNLKESKDTENPIVKEALSMLLDLNFSLCSMLELIEEEQEKRRPHGFA